LQIDRYAVVGNPIKQSKSPLIHQLFAQATKQVLVYEAILSPLDRFAESVEAFRKQGGRGLNVTTPFKIEAFHVATQFSERAKAAGAVNALKFVDNQVLAENFDGVGLVRDTVVNLNQSIKDRRVLILGAGGATRGLLMPLFEQRPATLVIANRNFEKALALVNEAQEASALVGTQSFAIDYEHLKQQAPFDIVFNATSASLRAEFPPISSDIFSKTGLAYELAYGRGLTPFLQIAKESGVEHLADGVGMLVEQAAEAFLWWRGIRPETKWVIEHISSPLHKKG
jgi:shikimate dehydrogenase